MATVKSYTDLQQSKKLAEILPLESADMYYFRQIDNDYFPPNVESICPIPLFKDGKEDFDYDIPCWSLVALLNVIPFWYDIHPVKNGVAIKCDYGKEEIVISSNAVDACVEMIIKLHELNLL